VALVCPSQGIDATNTNPCAQFQLNILGAVAEFERELITGRVNAGITAAKQRGVRLGRPIKTARYAEQVREFVQEGLSAADQHRAKRQDGLFRKEQREKNFRDGG